MLLEERQHAPFVLSPDSGVQINVSGFLYNPKFFRFVRRVEHRL